MRAGLREGPRDRVLGAGSAPAGAHGALSMVRLVKASGKQGLPLGRRVAGLRETLRRSHFYRREPGLSYGARGCPDLQKFSCSRYDSVDTRGHVAVATVFETIPGVQSCAATEGITVHPRGGYKEMA